MVRGGEPMSKAYIAVCNDEIIAVFEDSADADLFWLRNKGVADCLIYEADFYPSGANHDAPKA